MGGISRQGVRGKAVPCFGLLLDVTDRQRDLQLFAFGVAQADDKQHGGCNDRADGHQLAGAQAGIANEQRVGAQTFDPAAAQAVPDDIGQEDLPVELAALDKACQDDKACQAPDAFIQESRMHRSGGVDSHTGGQCDLHRLQVGFGSLAVHAPGQRSVRAEGLLIDEVAPAADALADEEAQRDQVEQRQQRDLAPLGGQPAEHERADDRAVDGNAA